MHIAEVVTQGTTRVVRLPPTIMLEDGAMQVLRLGDSLLLTPAPPTVEPPAGPPPSPPPLGAAASRARAARPQIEKDLDDALALAWREIRAQRAARGVLKDRTTLSDSAVA